MFPRVNIIVLPIIDAASWIYSKICCLYQSVHNNTLHSKNGRSVVLLQQWDGFNCMGIEKSTATGFGVPRIGPKNPIEHTPKQPELALKD